MPARELLDGYKRFRTGYYENNRALFEKLRGGQQPQAIVISCCDSRVDPGLIFDAAPGELFMVRNVANLVPPYESDNHFHGTSAALEFSVTGLGVKHVIVLGHAGCGGIQALAEGAFDTTASSGFINRWMSIAAKSLAEVLQEHGHDTPTDVLQTALEQKSILNSLKNLMDFPFIRDRVAAGTLHLHGLYFDIADARLLRADPRTGTFIPMDDN